MTGHGEDLSPPVARPGRRGIRPELWGVLDQALVSGVNFLTIVLLARAISPREFGYFVLAFTLLQTAGTLQAALITRPHNVLGAVREGRAYADYSTTTAVAQCVFTGVLVALVLVGGALLYAIGSTQAALVFALAFASAAWQFQELGRRMLYTEQRLAGAFANDLFTYGAQALALIALLERDLLTGEHAFLALGAIFAVGAAALTWQHRRSLSGRFDRDSFRGAWAFGKWLGVAEVGQWLSTQYYVYLAAAILGAVASAALKAGQTLLGPMSVFLTFVTSYLPIVLVRELEVSGSVRATVRRSLGGILVVVVPYSLVMAVFAVPVLEAVYGPEYRQYAEVVQLFSVYYILLAFSTVAIALLSAESMTRHVFAGQAAGAAFSLALGWIFLEEFGPAGGVVAMLLSWGLAMVVFVRALRGPSARGARAEPVGARVRH